MVPATSFQAWLRTQGPAEYQKACKAQQTEAHRHLASGPTPPKRKKKTANLQPSPLVEEDDDDTTDTDENVNNWFPRPNCSRTSYSYIEKKFKRLSFQKNKRPGTLGVSHSSFSGEVKKKY